MKHRKFWLVMGVVYAVLTLMVVYESGVGTGLQQAREIFSRPSVKPSLVPPYFQGSTDTGFYQADENTLMLVVDGKVWYRLTYTVKSSAGDPICRVAGGPTLETSVGKHEMTLLIPDLNKFLIECESDGVAKIEFRDESLKQEQQEGRESE